MAASHFEGQGAHTANSTPLQPARQAGKKPGPYAAHFIVKEREYYDDGQLRPKRARCQWCGGEWAYNQTRLRRHIMDFQGGCPQIPFAERMKARELDEASRCRWKGGKASHSLSQDDPGILSSAFESDICSHRPAAASWIGPPLTHDFELDKEVGQEGALGLESAMESQNCIRVDYAASCASQPDISAVMLGLISSAEFPEMKIYFNRRCSHSLFEVSAGSRLIWSSKKEGRAPSWPELRALILDDSRVFPEALWAEMLSPSQQSLRPFLPSSCLPKSAGQASSEGSLSALQRASNEAASHRICEQTPCFHLH